MTVFKEVNIVNIVWQLLKQDWKNKRTNEFVLQVICLALCCLTRLLYYNESDML